ncbi:type II secretion system major pseudopilin GspG [Enterobacter ludwigii]|uniref:type II secretion system major pseudopilin GspG n=1 Tax=Enterobacter ludwigii TaxID=299767 RepID=UPI001E56EAAC|nr:type II secretion system major pseudopilin GspG [Enterobacter ludwigii]MCE1613401.1 type II secretion system major pseudopilin GspG [Enterobacter ludwigii]MCE1626702.1 type II secretion system major pseudopilin GspG [Enterobacter ludwigii]
MRSKTLPSVNRKHSGFTLLEIMVVIVILGLLASFIVPNLMGNKDKADRQKASSDLVALENALDMYRLDNGRYPTAEQGLHALIEKPSIPPVPAHYPEEGYLRFLPQDPWGNDYRLIAGKKGRAHVISAGPDGEFDTADDISNVDEK